MDFSKNLSSIFPTSQALILEELIQTPKPVSGRQLALQLVDRLGKSRVLDVLGELVEQGLVTREILGPSHLYSINKQHLCFALALWNGRTTAPYNVAAYKPGLPTASEVIFQFVTPTAFTLADNFAGSQGYVEVNPTASATFDVKKNGTNIGTVVVGTGGGFTFATSGTGLETFSVGDRLTVAAPGTPDATLSGFHVAFAGTRTI